MSYEDLLNRIEIEEDAAAGAGSGVSAPGSEGATTEDNVAYLPSQLGVVKPGKKKKKKDRPVEEGEGAIGDYLDIQDSVDDEIVREWMDNRGHGDVTQGWNVVSASRLKKIWKDRVSSGIIRDESGLRNIADLIVKNIAKIHTNTILMGHGTSDELEVLLDQTGIEEGDLEGFEDFAVDDDGAWRLSDYGLDPLKDIALDILEITDPEALLVAVDKALHVVHQRSDLSSWFVQGGQSTLNQLANESVSEGEHDLPVVQQDALEALGPAEPEDMMEEADMLDEPFVKFWLLNDGTLLWVREGHLEGSFSGWYDELLKTGAMRVSSDPGKEMALEFQRTPTVDQIIALRGLAELHNTAVVVIERSDNTSLPLADRGRLFPLNSPKEMGDIVRGKTKKKSLAAQFHESVNEGGPEPTKEEFFSALSTLKTATNSQLSQKSTYEGEEVVKLWVAPDGNMYWNSEAHYEVPRKVSNILSAGHLSYDVLRGFGMIRICVDIDSGDMGLDFTQRPTSQQIRSVQGLAKMHAVEHVALEQEGEDIPISSSQELSAIMRGQTKRKSLVAQFHEAMEDDMTKLRQDLKPALIRLFEGDPFHLVETDAKLWASRFGVDKYLSEDSPLVAIENKIRGVQSLAGTILQNYGNDRGYLEMVIDAMEEREPLSSFDGFKENDYLYGTRIRSNHEGVEMVFEASLDPLYVVSETVYIDNEDVLDRWESMVGGIKRVGAVVYPQGERFTPDTLQKLEHAIIDSIDDQEEME